MKMKNVKKASFRYFTQLKKNKFRPTSNPTKDNLQNMAE